MSTIVIDENKNPRITLTDDSKMHNETWAQRTEQWGQDPKSWGVPGIIVITETKHMITVTDENKN